MDPEEDKVPINKIIQQSGDNRPLQGNFGSMPMNQGSLQTPVSNYIETGLGQGQQTEFFTDNMYTILAILVIWVFIVSIDAPNKVFKVLGIHTLVYHDSDKLTILGSGLVAGITILVYFLAHYLGKR